MRDYKYIKNFETTDYSAASCLIFNNIENNERSVMMKEFQI